MKYLYSQYYEEISYRPKLNFLIISHALIAYFISSKQWVQRGKSPIQAHLPYQKDIMCL